MQAFSEPTRDLVTVHPRHAEIEEYQLGLELTNELECSGAVVSHLYVMALQTQ